MEEKKTVLNSELPRKSNESGTPPNKKFNKMLIDPLGPTDSEKKARLRSDTEEKSTSVQTPVSLKKSLFSDQSILSAKHLLQIFEMDQSVGMWMKLSLMNRRAFLTFKEYSKQGKILSLVHRDHGDGVSKHFLRRICARRVGKALKVLDFEFSALNDDHIALA